MSRTADDLSASDHSQPRVVMIRNSAISHRQHEFGMRDEVDSHDHPRGDVMDSLTVDRLSQHEGDIIGRKFDNRGQKSLTCRKFVNRGQQEFDLQEESADGKERSSAQVAGSEKHKYEEAGVPCNILTKASSFSNQGPMLKKDESLALPINKKEAKSTLRSIEELIIPPRNRMLCMGRVVNYLNTDWLLVKPSQKQLTGTLIARFLNQNATEIPIQIMNISSRAIKIEKERVIGLVRSAERIIEDRESNGKENKFDDVRENPDDSEVKKIYKF